MIAYNPFSLSRKVILVTGASSGIGRAIAIECSRLGAALILTGRNKERLEETLGLCEGDNHLLYEADLTDENAVGSLVGLVPDLDGIVLCSGKGATAPFNFSSKEKFMDVFDTNFFSPMEFALCQNGKRSNLEARLFLSCQLVGYLSFL